MQTKWMTMCQRLMTQRCNPLVPCQYQVRQKKEPGVVIIWRRDGTCWYCGYAWHDCGKQVFGLGVTVFMLTEGLPCKKCAVPGPGSPPLQSCNGPADEVSDMASGSWCHCRMVCEGICSWACWVGMGPALGLKSLPVGGATLVLPRVSQSQKPYILYKTHKLSR